MYKIIDVNENNLNEYGLFCKQSQKKEIGYQNKITWIKERFKEGMKYKLLQVKEGKRSPYRGFIEYTPGEYNWRGIDANGFMVIHCIWVVGRHKQKGYASKLLECCINDVKEGRMYGIVGMSAEKGGWLPRKEFYEKNGFERVDEYPPHFGLFTKFLSDNAPKPRFHEISRNKIKTYDEGIAILYSDQCPYIPIVVDEVKQFAKNSNLSLQIIKLRDYKEAQFNQIHPYGTYCIICNGELLSYKPGMWKQILDLLKAKQ
ncbi:MAG: GNAT family N-acetyltransferase [Candidatus Thorarchaeota archaeon]